MDLAPWCYRWDWIRLDLWISPGGVRYIEHLYGANNKTVLIHKTKNGEQTGPLKTIFDKSKDIDSSSFDKENKWQRAQ